MKSAESSESRSKRSKGNARGTTRKTKFVAQKELVDSETGERIQGKVVEVEDRDFNFQKLWIGHILEAIDEFGGAKVKVLAWLLDNVDSRNAIVGTVREMSKAIGVSYGTVSNTLQILDKHDIINRRTGLVMVNPNCVFKGGHGRRMNVLIRYNQLGETGSLFDENGQPAKK